MKTIARAAIRTTAQNLPKVSALNGVELRPVRYPSFSIRDIVNSYQAIRIPGVRLFHKDVGLGVNSAKADRFFARNELSTDSAGPIMLMVNNAEEYRKQLDAYRAAARNIRGKDPILSGTFARHPWVELKHADREVLDDPEIPYVQYSRQAIQTAFERGGKVQFYLGGGFQVAEYAANIIETEIRENMDFARFASTVDYPKLANLAAAIKEAEAMARGMLLDEEDDSPIPKMPKITSVELFDLVKGDFSDNREKVEYVADNGTVLDTKTFIATHDKLLETIGTAENRALVAAGSPMSPAAQKSIADFQEYLNTGRAPAV